MALVLRVLVAGSCSVAEGETRVCDGDSFSIGRGAENDWVVADPQRHLSKQHCRIERRDDGYYVVDTSKNGVFVSGSAAPLGTGNATPVKTGDEIDLGPLSLRVEIVAKPVQPDRVNGAAFWPVETAEAPEPVSRLLRPAAVQELPIAALLADRPAPLQSVEIDAAPAISASFALPSAKRATIPADWHAEEANPYEAAAPRAELPEPAPFPTATIAPLPPPVPEPQPQPVSAAVPGDLLASFLAGAGLPPDAIETADAAETMHKLGLAFREAVGGLRELLELRAFLKSEFRIEHTLLRAKENNPLKFSANLEGALSVLLGRRVPGFMTPPEAIRESVRDVKAHEVALIAGMKSVIADTLDQLSPETVKSGVEDSLLPQVTKARCWEKYERLHQRLAGDQSSGPPLGSQFAKAYSQQFRTT